MNNRQQFRGIIGKSKKMQSVYSCIEDLADAQIPVLITGETGTGKELVAEALHCSGKYLDRPFVKIHCIALTENLFEIELLGYIKGAIDGSLQEYNGKLSMAEGGTVVFDEIGDISHNQQLLLLKILQKGEYMRIGDSTPVKLNSRIIVTTSQDIREKVRRGVFLEDLYKYLKTVEIHLEPLRNRQEDISLLIAHFMQKFNKKFHKKITAISQEVQKMFMNYSWPGNVKELENAMEHAFILCQRKTITVKDIPSDLKDAVANPLLL